MALNKEEIGKSLRQIKYSYKRLQPHEKITLVVISILLVTMPAAIAALQVTRLTRPGAVPVTPPVTPPHNINCLPDSNKVIKVFPAGSGQSCENFRDAVENLGDNMTIHLLPGVHNVHVESFEDVVEIADRQGIIVEGEGDGTLLRFNLSLTAFHALKITNSTAEVSNLVIETDTPGYMLKVEKSPNLSLSNLSLINTSGTAVAIIETQQAWLHNLIINADRGVDTYMVDNLVVETSTFTEAQYSITGSKLSITVFNNLFTDNTQGVISLNTANNVVITNNTIVNNINGQNIPAVSISDSDSQSLISNNIFSGNTVVLGGDSVENISFKNNNLWSNDTVFLGGEPQVDEGSLQIDPEYGDDYCISRYSRLVYGDIGAGEYIGTNSFCEHQSGEGGVVYDLQIQGAQGSRLRPALLTLRNENGTITKDGFVRKSPDGKYWFGVDRIAEGNYEALLKIDGYLAKLMFPTLISVNEDSHFWLEGENATILAGDFNGDNILNIEDIALMLSLYTKLTIPVEGVNEKYDITGDGVLNIVDIAIVLSNYTALNIPGDN